MQRIDLAFLLEIGDAARSIRRIQLKHDQQDRIETWFSLNSSINSIESIVYQSIYREHFHAPLISAAGNVIDISNQYIEKMFPENGDGQDLVQWELDSLKNAYTKFETILISELQSLASYLVTRKSGFDIATMVDAGRAFFSQDLAVKVPKAIPDLEQAMRCIAFEVPTAAGFHLHRGNESVLRVYWDHVTGGDASPEAK